MADTVLTYLDTYCERAGQAGLLAEPLNAASNFAFLIAAAMALLVLLKRRDISSLKDGLKVTASPVFILIVLLAAIGIGIGSLLWHLFASAGTMLGDVLPIALFIHVYLFACLRWIIGLEWRWVTVWWCIFFVCGLAAQLLIPADLLHGTIMYVPTYLALAILTGVLYQRNSAQTHMFAMTLVLWTISLVFRTIDLPLCPAFPLGTHFVWHLLNAVVLYRLIVSLIHTRAADIRIGLQD